MNRTEHLLMCLAEECAEVQQAIAKALRFGLADGYPDTDRTNVDDITAGVEDVFALVEMLQDENVLPALQRIFIEPKKEWVKRFIEYEEQRGTLTPNVKLTSGAHTAHKPE